MDNNKNREIRKRRNKSKLSRQQRKRRIFFILILIIVIATPLVLRSGIFNIDKITVKGNSLTNSQDIIERGALQRGKNYFLINKSKAKKEIQKLPYVNTVNISYGFPGKVIIRVTERKALSQIYYDEEYYLVDKEIRILGKTKEFNTDLIKITGINMRNKKIGLILYDTENEKNKEEFMIKFLNSGLYPYIKSAEILDDSINMTTKDNIRIIFGAFKNYDYKLKFLQETLDKIKLDNKKVSMILMEKSDNPILVLDNEDGEIVPKKEEK